MLYISELLPNPAGKDTEGEWIEVCVAGAEAQPLAGWKLQNAKGKTFTFPDRTLSPYECVAFDYADTKLTLTNTGTTFYLINPTGEITDTATYEGTYKDDVSAMRTNPTSGFVMSSTPTKGSANRLTALKSKTSGSSRDYVASVADTSGQKTKEVIDGNASYGDAILAGALTATVLTGVFWYIFKKLTAPPSS